MRLCLCLLMMVASVVGIGCDDKDDVPPDVLSKARQQENELAKQRKLPTTQELLSSQRRRLRLGDFPLSVEVPKDWELKSYGGEVGVIMLSGPASSGDIQIQLIQQTQSSPLERIQAAFSGAKTEMAAKPHPINRLELRDLGPAKVLEQRMISTPFVGGKLPPEQIGDIVSRDEKTGFEVKTKGVLNPHMVRWTITAFVPSGKDQAGKEQYLPRGLAFSSLRLAEYEQDKGFLEGLIKSLQYEE